MQMSKKKMRRLFEICGVLFLFVLILVVCVRKYDALFDGITRIPVLGWIVAYNFPPRDYYLPVVHCPLAAGNIKQTVVCKYSGRYDIHIVGVKSNSVEHCDVSIMAEAADGLGKSIWRDGRSSSELFKYFSSRDNCDEGYRYFYLTFRVPEDVPCNAPFELSIRCEGAIDELLQCVPEARVEVVKVFDK